METKVVGVYQDRPQGADTTGCVELTVTDTTGRSRVLRVSQVLLSLKKDDTCALLAGNYSLPRPRQRLLADVVEAMPLFKVFLVWERSWWGDNFPHGKSTSDLDIRQCHYYSGHKLLVYCSGEYAVRWRNRLKTHILAHFGDRPRSKRY